jgi:hypothetical protein
LSAAILLEQSHHKSYRHPVNKALLKEVVSQVVMPKKGKTTQNELEEEQEVDFKKLRNKHSAVESNIHSLEHSSICHWY